ncbi:MAG: transcription antitermination factor NusB [Oscillospiraceae bacterium]|nr:transcription antitermination factor NusB [Oscillospiraceae bacterium]
MTRTAARELAMLIGFSGAPDAAETVEERLDLFFDREHYATLAGEDPLFAEYPNKRQMDYIRSLVELMWMHHAELDAHIAANARGWKPERLSRAAAAILRCALCEILYLPDVPDAVAINEALEIAKKYEDEETVAFINGVLGGFMRGRTE